MIVGDCENKFAIIRGRRNSVILSNNDVYDGLSCHGDRQKGIATIARGSQPMVRKQRRGR